nr:uncharacterized protein LOC109188710 [Ipomoea batatas]
MAGTPSSVNVTLGSNKSLPFTDITNVNGNMRSKKINGSLTLTGVSIVDNTVNRPKWTGNTKSCDMYIPRANNTEKSNQDVVIPRDLSQDFDEVIENIVHSVPYDDCGDASYTCEHCGATFWYNERLSQSRVKSYPKYGVCCTHGKINLPSMSTPPKELYELFFEHGEKRTCFLKNIRSYNSMFSFTSMGGKIDNSINCGGALPIFRINGQAKFAQLLNCTYMTQIMKLITVFVL